MPIMGSESHHRGHPLPDPTQFPARTPLSVPQLLSSRPSAANSASASAYHPAGDAVPLPSVHPTLSRSTPPTPPALSAPVDASTAAERPSWTAVNHASPHVSPATTKLPPIAAHIPQTGQSLPQPVALSGYPTATPEVSTSPHDAARSLTPISHRQDSAISQHRVEPPKEAQAFGASSDLNSYQSHPSPNHRQRSTSPRSNSYPATPSSPQSANQVPAYPGVQTQSKDLSTSRPSTSHRSPAAAAAAADAADHSTNNHTRQQRYNVRFNQAYTPDNMPPSQKARNEPSAAVFVSSETTESRPKSPEPPVTPTKTSSMLPIPLSAEDQSQTQPRREDPSVERCKYCNEVWRRPIPNFDQYQNPNEVRPATNSDDMARNSMNLIARLRSIGNQADAAYDRWCYRHRFCVPPPEGMRPSSPSSTDTQSDGFHSNADGSRRDSRIAETTTATTTTTTTTTNNNNSNNKRKSDVPHENDRQVNPKFRKVTFKT